MLVKDKKYAVAVSDMQGWRISEFLERRVDGVRLQGSPEMFRAARRVQLVACMASERGKRRQGIPKPFMTRQTFCDRS